MCVNLQVLISYLPILFCTEDWQIGQVLIGLHNNMYSLSGGNFFFTSCRAQQSFVKKHRGLQHQLHPFVQVQYSSVM